YKIQDVEITKTICMEYEKNTVGIYYKIKNGEKDAKLILAPIVNFRDFHTVNNEDHFEVRQFVHNAKVKLILNGNSQTPIYLNLSEGNYIIHENDIFRNMFYVEEQKRGFYPEENHCVTGIYEVEIKAGEQKNISFVCSLEDNIEEIDVQDMIDKEIWRLDKIVKNTELIDDQNKKKTKKQINKEELI